MLRVIAVAALASIVSGCVTSDQDKPYSQLAKPRPARAANPIEAAKVTADAIKSAKISKPQIVVVGAAY